MTIYYACSQPKQPYAESLSQPISDRDIIHDNVALEHKDITMIVLSSCPLELIRASTELLIPTANPPSQLLLRTSRDNVARSRLRRTSNV